MVSLLCVLSGMCDEFVVCVVRNVWCVCFVCCQVCVLRLLCVLSGMCGEFVVCVVRYVWCACCVCVFLCSLLGLASCVRFMCLLSDLFLF